MAQMTEEVENYVKMCFLLVGISQRAARVYFDSEFDPSCLKKSLQAKNMYDKLLKLKNDRIINQSQWNLLFPLKGCVPSSNTFDITLIITLLRNLINLSPPDNLPSVTNSTPSAALATLKYYRNEISHIKNAEITSSYFNKAWDDITGAVGRLGGTNMLEECKKLRTNIFEPSIVPWNIRVQIKDMLEAWKTNDSTFVETRAAKHVLTCIQENSCVTITASSGVGKTATLQHVALKMIDEGYDVLFVTNAHDIVNFYNPDQKTLFVMDDFCGTYSINKFDLNSLEQDMKHIQGMIKNKLTKIIVACRLQVYQDRRFESLSIFRTCVCNLHSDDLCLSKTEKQSIAELYLDTKSSEIIQYCDLYDCFPLLCELYNDNQKFNITDFFQNPFSVFEAEINMLFEKGKYRKYCALALCVMSNNKLKEEWFTDDIDPQIRAMIENTCEACRLNRGTPRLVLLDELNTLEYSFVKKEQGVYKTKHDKLFDFLSHYFGQKMIQCMIRNSDSLVIMQRFILEKTDDINEFITVVPPAYHEKYIQRMIDDWSKEKIEFVFSNINMEKPKFRQRILGYLHTLDTSYQRELALTCDFYTKDTVLFHCCKYDAIPLMQWCINHDVDVNQGNRFNISPLFVSIITGNIKALKFLLDNNAKIDKRMYVARSSFLECMNHTEIFEKMCTILGRSFSDLDVPPNTKELVKEMLDNTKVTMNCGETTALFAAVGMNDIEIVKVLIDNKADINMCLGYGASALHCACALKHIEILKVLLDNKADLNKCLHGGMSPLFLACLLNHIEIVNVLLDNKADIAKCMDDGASPLFIACQENHIEILKVLLENKADINKCMDYGKSPLYIACKQNHIEIVKVLLDNKADTNKCYGHGASPLYVACWFNHIEIVKVLLDNKVDIDKCMANGASPLYAACFFNHIEIVKVLLENNADINKCTVDGASPLFIACMKNYKEIVKILLENQADIKKRMGNGVSPLFIACENNHIEIVKILLDNKADANKCNKNGISPLYIGCLNNHIEMVKALLDNKADINLCNDNGASPLWVACHHNHIEIVKVLLDNKADINKCTDNGASPLYVTCRHNYNEVLKVLLDNKADIDKCMNNGASPLYGTCEMNYIETVKILLENKADINKCMNNGASPLIRACEMNHIETVKMLLNNKADINKCRNNGVSPLFVACQNNHIEILKVLLDNKADIDQCRDNGKSPFYIACYKKNIELVRMLLEKGANYHACAKGGISPIKIARRMGHSVIVNMINEHSRNEEPPSKQIKSCYPTRTPQRRSARKMPKHDQYDCSSTTPKRASQRKTPKICQSDNSSTTTQNRSPSKKLKSEVSFTTPQNRSVRKRLHNDQSDNSSTTTQNRSPSKKLKSEVSFTTPQKRSVRKRLHNDQSDNSSTTTQKRSPSKKLKIGCSLTTPNKMSPRKTTRSQVVKLVGSTSFTVNSEELRKIVLKAKGEKNTGSYLVLKLMSLVFSREEMSNSRGIGLKPAKTGDIRLPLDADKIKSVKAYSEGFCRKNGYKQATNAEMNRAISQAVAYSRKKLKIQ